MYEVELPKIVNLFLSFHAYSSINYFATKIIDLIILILDIKVYRLVKFLVLHNYVENAMLFDVVLLAIYKCSCRFCNIEHWNLKLLILGAHSKKL